jgi:hypothetical protein
MAKRDQDYLSYLLRLWRVKDRNRWRASLERADTHERRSFANLGDLFEFLGEQTGTSPEVEEKEEDNHES